MMIRRLLHSVTLAGLVLAVLCTASMASAQHNDALWNRYLEAATTFGELYAQTEELDPIATRGNRIYRDTIDAGQQLVDVLDELLALEEGITPEEGLAALDSLLTTRQIIGALMVEVQQCNEGLAELDSLLEHPGLADRPLVLESTTLWKGRAETCIAQQERASERERRAAELEAEQQRLADEAAAREAELRDLEERMAVEEDEEVLAEMQRRMNELSAEQAVWLEPALSKPALGSYILIGAGALSLGTGMVWDFTLRDERSDFNDIVYESESTTPEIDAADEKEAIDNAKVPIGVLYGAGIGMIVGGVVWNRLSRHRDRGADEGSAQLTPFFADDGGGMVFTRTF